MIYIKIDKTEKERINKILNSRTWSFSSVNCYRNCHKCFYLSYLHEPRLERDENAFAQWGTLGHSIFERYADGAIELYEMGEIYENEYDETVTLDFPPNKYVDLNSNYYDKGLSYFENFNGFPDNWEPVDSEKEFHLDIDGNKFIGYIDLIVRDKNTGRYIIVDHKSKSKFENATVLREYARQLYLYSLYIKETYGEYPSQLIFNMFRANQIVTIEFEETDIKEAVKWFTDTIQEIKKDRKFQDVIAAKYRLKKKSLREFKKDDFFCNELCSCRSYCKRSRDYVKVE